MRASLVAALLLLASLAALPAASAASPSVEATGGPCSGLLLGGKLTGYCLNDPNCPGPFGYGTGYYANGILVACSLQ